MNYTFMPSLKHRALVKITAALWNQSDIRDLVARCSTLCYLSTIKRKEWQVIENKVTGRVPNLPLPESLKKEVMHLAQRMGLEVKKFKEYHGFRSGHYLTNIPAELCWTPQGTVDHKKTAQLLVKDESIDITTRYILACIYCLEDHVKKLWNSMPQIQKKDIYNERNFCDDFELIRLWTCKMTGETTKCNDLITEDLFADEREVSPYHLQFELSAKPANKVAVGYFLQKLTLRERDESLVKCGTVLAHKHLLNTDLIIEGNFTNDYFQMYDAEILCFLLSQMDVQQREKLLKDGLNNPVGILSCLLDWPYETFFMETASWMYNVISPVDFELILKVMVKRIIHGFKNCSYHKLFREFRQQSPNTYKKFVCGRLTQRFLLSDLLHIEDKENVSLIFENVTMEEREEIIFSSTGVRICESLICKNKWNVLKYFVQQCIPSEDMMIKIEQQLRQIISDIPVPEESADSQNDLWMKFSLFLDELNEDFKKRGMEEGANSPFHPKN